MSSYKQTHKPKKTKPIPRLGSHEIVVEGNYQFTSFTALGLNPVQWGVTKLDPQEFFDYLEKHEPYNLRCAYKTRQTWSFNKKPHKNDYLIVDREVTGYYRRTGSQYHPECDHERCYGQKTFIKYTWSRYIVPQPYHQVCYKGYNCFAGCPHCKDIHYLDGTDRPRVVTPTQFPPLPSSSSKNTPRLSSRSQAL